MNTSDIKRYITGGKAIFTLQSTKIDRRYTYRIRVDKYNKSLFFVDVLFGPDRYRDYRLLGIFCKDTFILKAPGRVSVPSTDVRYVMIDHFLQFLCTRKTLPDACKFYMSGRCARCGRILTTPESIESGFGPECIKLCNRNSLIQI